MKTDNRDIYEQIGNLFYAVAADQHVKPLEVAELKLLVTKEWLPRNSQKQEFPISDEAHCILIAMDTLQANQATASEAYREFSKFFSMHPEAFTPELKKNISHTVAEIVEIFQEDNTSVNTHQQALKDLFKTETTHSR
jgi:hypothetical protein